MPCARMSTCQEHPCKRLCSEVCICQEKVTITLPCGHEQKVLCSKKNQPERCRATITIQSPFCEHPVKTLCYISQITLDQPEFINAVKCNLPCNKQRDCQHKCQTVCHKCPHNLFPERLKTPEPCKKATPHRLGCGHDCTGKCGHSQYECPPCLKNCATQCGHSKCGLRCHESCAICAEECQWACEDHPEPKHKCATFCGSPCVRLPCDQRCTKLLSCKHPCPSICGEKCPDSKVACRHCVSEAHRDRTICMLDIDLTIVSNASEQLVIQLGCGHAWTVCSLDGMLQLDQLFYERDLRTGQWTGLRETTIQDVTAAGLKAECPTCKKKITRIPRYGRALNFLAEMEIKQSLLKEAAALIQKWRTSRLTLVRAAANHNQIAQQLSKGVDTFESMIKRDPTKALSEREQRGKQGHGPREVKRFFQPFALMGIELLELFLLLESSSPYDPKSRLRALQFGINICKGCQTHQLEASYHNAKRSMIWLLQSCAPQELLLMKPALKELNDSDFEQAEGSNVLLPLVQAIEREIGTGVGNFGGHWYQCPNGHIFTIGECGGPVQICVCFECGSAVGGRHHRLLLDRAPSSVFEGVSLNAFIPKE